MLQLSIILARFFEVYTFPLAVIYTALAIVALVQLSLIIYRRDKILSYQMFFLLLCVTWGIFRLLYFYFVPIWARWKWILNVMLWIPYNIEFAIFTLLILFYANVVYRKEWERSAKAIAYGCYVGANTFFAIILLSCGLMFAFDVPLKEIVRISGCFVDFMFSALVIIIAWFSYQMSVQLNNGERIPFLEFLGSARRITVINVTIFIIFFSRAAYDVVTTITNFNLLNVAPSTSPYAHVYHEAIVFSLLFWWDILPVLLVMILFGTYPKQHKEGGNARIPPVLDSATQTVNSGWAEAYRSQAHLFAETARYDTDDESTPISTSRQSSSVERAQTQIQYPYGTPGTTPSSFDVNGGIYSPYSTTPVQKVRMPGRVGGSHDGEMESPVASLEDEYRR
eukprot:TRINITY_DN3690_c0_g1_i2.p1 TRINITY_DN3690_c0_g1~~TRINITY_DN3690_c0_g1_i2.p1  ORF type:complete len:395 (-),score=67.08 TRINITY_DN3690_c0_g1_i2:1258-2442(-)